MSNNTTGIAELFSDIVDKPVEILFAHEEKQIVNLFFEMLKDLEKNDLLNLSSAQSGYEILDILKEKTFDVIIIDEELPSFDIPKVFHFLRVEHSETKIMFLAKKYDEYLNDYGSIQFCRKPFHFNDLRQRIADVIANSKLCARNLLPLDIINALGTIFEKSAIVIQNIADNSSGEIFIENKKVVQASVETNGSTLEDLEAITEILNWTDFEGCISKGTPFPEKENYSIEIDISHIYDNDYNENKPVELSEDSILKLQEYLTLVFDSITDGFVMNAFCTTQCMTHASVKDPEFSEILYKMSDKIVGTFINGLQEINANHAKYNVLNLNDQFDMVLFKLDRDIWYYTILKESKKIEELTSIVNDFSLDAVNILSADKKKVYAEIVD